jgi:hypothetical protein
MQRTIVRMIRTHGWMPQRSSPGFWVVLTAVALLEGAVYWVISGFFFAGVASNVLGGAGSEKPLLTDAFTMARQRFGAITAVALVIWAGFALSRGIVGLALFSILDRLGLMGNLIVVTVTLVLLLLLLGGLFSRLGLAIPALIDNPGNSVSQSLRRSLAKTESWEPFFILFLAKSAALGYAAYWLLNFGLDRLADRGMPREDARIWLTSALYVSLAAALESPLFIAFSLLYRDSKLKREEAFPVVVG